MKLIMAALFSVLASMALATVDGFPALYDVTGVAADDNLNIRETPNAGSIIVSSFPPMAKNIEVIALNDAETWGLVNIDGRSGWVSMRYMARHPGQYAGNVPNLTYCHGTEPFWDLEFTDSTVSFSSPENTGPLVPFTAMRSTNRIDRFAIVATGMTGVVIEQRCSDGMSDFTYGLAVELLAPLYGEMQLLSGCCTIQP